MIYNGGSKSEPHIRTWNKIDSPPLICAQQSPESPLERGLVRTSTKLTGTQSSHNMVQFYIIENSHGNQESNRKPLGH